MNARSIRAIVLAACALAVIASACSGGDAASSLPSASTVPVGQSSSVGPFTIEVTQAVSTVEPHTYRLTMSLKNRGAKPARVPDVELGCKGGLGPQGFGLTGVMVGSDTKISPHAARRGDLILYPYQVCEDSTVRFSTRVRTSGHVRTEQVTYSLKGLI